MSTKERGRLRALSPFDATAVGATASADAARGISEWAVSTTVTVSPLQAVATLMVACRVALPASASSSAPAASLAVATPLGRISWRDADHTVAIAAPAAAASRGPIRIVDAAAAASTACTDSASDGWVRARRLPSDADQQAVSLTLPAAAGARTLCLRWRLRFDLANDGHMLALGFPLPPITAAAHHHVVVHVRARQWDTPGVGASCAGLGGGWRSVTCPTHDLRLAGAGGMTLQMALHPPSVAAVPGLHAPPLPPPLPTWQWAQIMLEPINLAYLWPSLRRSTDGARSPPSAAALASAASPAVPAPPQLLSTQIPRHIAVVMDGNGRWAKGRGLPRSEGHVAGVEAIHRIIRGCRRVGVRYLTLYAFSAQNWDRPADEVRGLMALLLDFVNTDCEELIANGVRLLVNGEVAKLPAAARHGLERLVRVSAGNDALTLCLALSYGGREEIATAASAAAAAAAAGRLDVSRALTVAEFRRFMPHPDVPDPDLLIRTSGELRLSNFLLWQLAYTELYVTPVLWPDFGDGEFVAALLAYSSRQRRFGLTGEQVTATAAPGGGTGAAGSAGLPPLVRPAPAALAAAYFPGASDSDGSGSGSGSGGADGTPSQRRAARQAADRRIAQLALVDRGDAGVASVGVLARVGEVLHRWQCGERARLRCWSAMQLAVFGLWTRLAESRAGTADARNRPTVEASPHHLPAVSARDDGDGARGAPPGEAVSGDTGSTPLHHGGATTSGDEAAKSVAHPTPRQLARTRRSVGAGKRTPPRRGGGASATSATATAAGSGNGHGTAWSWKRLALVIAAVAAIVIASAAVGGAALAHLWAGPKRQQCWLRPPPMARPPSAAAGDGIVPDSAVDGSAAAADARPASPEPPPSWTMECVTQLAWDGDERWLARWGWWRQWVAAPLAYVAPDYVLPWHTGVAAAPQGRVVGDVEVPDHDHVAVSAAEADKRHRNALAPSRSTAVATPGVRGSGGLSTVPALSQSPCDEFEATPSFSRPPIVPLRASTPACPTPAVSFFPFPASVDGAASGSSVGTVVRGSTVQA